MLYVVCGMSYVVCSMWYVVCSREKRSFTPLLLCVAKHGVQDDRKASTLNLTVILRRPEADEESSSFMDSEVQGSDIL